uniref:ATP synthase subunit E containing protein n=1 Tax=Babesia bovis TaxID=5865 RepID=S6B3Z1_BABBO|nr:ATP synthase subunit E containing protein [Babesia bovis]
MDDIEAQRQIKQMVNFILNEAKDKAEEIESSAIEDFNVQKMTLFQQKKDEIKLKITRKISMLKLEKIRAHNSASREIQDHVVRHQATMIETIAMEAMEKIKAQMSNVEDYRAALVLLILKGLMSLASSNVLIRCRKEDVGIVQQSIEQAKVQYQKMARETFGTSSDLNASIDSDTYLPPEKIGVIVTTHNGKVECNCTFASRLQAYCEKLIPEFKTVIFK